MELTCEQEKEIKKLGKYLNGIRMTSEENIESLEEGFRDNPHGYVTLNKKHNPLQIINSKRNKKAS